MSKIVCVDDDREQLHLIREILEMDGYRALTAQEPLHGIFLVERYAPDLAIVDFDMPGMNGTELARSMRRRRPGMPILMFSGGSAVVDPAVDVFLSKGQGPLALLRAVRGILISREVQS